MSYRFDWMDGDSIGNLVKLFIIGVFSLISFIVTLYAIMEHGNALLIERYYLIPHLYIIPIILVSLWYPKRGMQVVMLLIGSIVVLTTVFFLTRHSIDPILSLLNAGIDVWIVLALAMKVRDKRVKVQESVSPQAPQKDNHELGKDPIQGYADALTLDDERVREEAVRALGALGDGRGVPILVKALNDESRLVREEAARSLGKVGDSCVVLPLVETLRDPHRNVREAAVQALAACGEMAIDTLIDTLNDQDWHLRMGAVIALRIIGDTRAVDPLLKSLQDTNRFVRREAVKSLGRFGDTRAQNALMELLKDDDQTVRSRAEVALMKIHGRQYTTEDKYKDIDNVEKT